MVASTAGGAALLALAVLLPAPSNAERAQVRPATSAIGSMRSIGSFTPAVQDPRLAAALANRRPSIERGFQFTPAASADRDRQVRVAVRARPGVIFPSRSEQTRGAGTSSALQTQSAPAFASSSYNLGMSVGWRRFAVTGDVERSDGGIVPGTRESARVGVDYRATRRLTGRVQVGTERADGAQRIVTDERAYSVDVGGSYSIARNVDLTGGVRYRVTQDRLDPLTRDERRDSQAVYIGTAFRF